MLTLCLLGVFPTLCHNHGSCGILCSWGTMNATRERAARTSGHPCISLLLRSHACSADPMDLVQNMSSKITLLRISKWQQQTVKPSVGPFCQLHGSPASPHPQAAERGECRHTEYREVGITILHHNHALPNGMTRGKALNSLAIRVLMKWVSCIWYLQRSYFYNSIILPEWEGSLKFFTVFEQVLMKT